LRRIVDVMSCLVLDDNNALTIGLAVGITVFVVLVIIIIIVVVVLLRRRRDRSTRFYTTLLYVEV